MAISYSNFLTQVRNYTEVDSNVLSDTILDQFINLMKEKKKCSKKCPDV